MLGLFRRAAHTADDISISIDVRSFEQFQALKSTIPQLFSADTEREIVQHTRRSGIATKFLGRIGPAEVMVSGDEMRESMWCAGLNSRMRAMLDEIVNYGAIADISDADLKIYGHEAITKFALTLRGRYPKFIGSEFCRTQSQRDEIFPVPHGDICASDFPSGAFHLIVSGDVLEHVSDIDMALRESARILKPRGRMIATFPFAFDNPASERYASMQNGEIVFHTKPIYHSDPMNKGGGVVVFEIPGWDIVERGLAAGFSDVFMRIICDKTRGIVASCSDGYPSTLKGVIVGVFDKA